MKSKFIFSIMLMGFTCIAMDAPQDMQKESADRPKLLHTLEVVSPGAAFYTPDGKKLVVGTVMGKEIAVYDAQDYSKEPFLIHRRYDSCPLAVRADSAQLAVGCSLLPVELLDITTGQNAQTLSDTIAPGTLQYNNQGNLLLCANEKKCAVWDLRANTIIEELIQNQKSIAAFNPTNNAEIATVTFANSGKNLLTFWDWRSAKTFRGTQTEVPVDSVNYTNDGSKVVLTATDQFVTYTTKAAALCAYYTLYGKKSNEKHPIHVPKKKSGDRTDALRFMPGCRCTFIAGINTAQITVCDLEDENNTFHFSTDPGRRDDVWALAIHPDGKTLASGLYGENGEPYGSAQIWDISQIKEKITDNEERKSLTIRQQIIREIGKGNTERAFTNEECLARAAVERSEQR